MGEEGGLGSSATTRAKLHRLGGKCRIDNNRLRMQGSDISYFLGSDISCFVVCLQDLVHGIMREEVGGGH